MSIVQRVASVFLGFVALAHLLRFVFRIEIVADGIVLPLWISIFGALIPGGLAVALWRESRAKAHRDI